MVGTSRITPILSDTQGIRLSQWTRAILQLSSQEGWRRDKEEEHLFVLFPTRQEKSHRRQDTNNFQVGSFFAMLHACSSFEGDCMGIAEKIWPTDAMLQSKHNKEYHGVVPGTFYDTLWIYLLLVLFFSPLILSTTPWFSRSKILMFLSIFTLF